MRLFFTSCLLLGFVLIVSAQEGVLFKSFQKHYVEGGSQLIGNTIVGKHPSKDFNQTNVLNDQIKIVYVDIDEDPSTFSSSEATLVLPNTATKITYAGLYWSGLYPSEKSKMRKGSKQMIYTPEGNKSNAIEEIKLKINQNSYQDIKGSIIFDGNSFDTYKNDAPYVCYANITEQLKNNHKTTITVANVSATQGFMEGGSAGGWVLYVIYEDPTMPTKYCTTFQGFQEVDKEVVTIIFDDFQTKKETQTNAFVLMAALEGDTKVTSDACLVYNAEKEAFVALENEDRNPKNFFSSTISSTGKNPLQRKPASKNTLGLDIAKVALPDGIMKPNTKEITLQWRTKADRFYLFFTAFETEIPNELFTLKQDRTTTQITIPKKPTTPINQTLGPPPVVTFVAPTEVIINRDTPLQTKINNVENRPSINANGMKKGYYLVTNVFSKNSNAIEWKNYLNKQGFNARIFESGEKQWKYVYIESSTQLKEMIERKEVLNQFSYLTDIWVARVNL